MALKYLTFIDFESKKNKKEGRNNAIIRGRGKYLAEKRNEEGIEAIINMESHLMLPVKLQNWGLEDNSKQNPTGFQTLICKLFL